MIRVANLFTILAVVWASGLGVAHGQERFGLTEAPILHFPKIQHMAGTLDYKNIGEHDCNLGFEVPVRFRVNSAQIALHYPFRTVKTIGIRKGGEGWHVVLPPSGASGIQSELPESGFFLDLDIIFCNAAFATKVASGSWKIWHENGRKDLMADGRVESTILDGNTATYYQIEVPKMATNSVWMAEPDNEDGGGQSANYDFSVSLFLNFDTVNPPNEDVSRASEAYANVRVTTEPAHPPEEGKQ